MIIHIPQHGSAIVAASEEVPPIILTESQFAQLLAFVRDGLLDPRATPNHLKRLVPQSVPSGGPVMVFEFP